MRNIRGTEIPGTYDLDDLYNTRSGRLYWNVRSFDAEAFAAEFKATTLTLAEEAKQKCKDAAASKRALK